MYNVQNVNGDANNNKCFIANRDPRLSRSKKVEKIGDQYKNECNELKKKNNIENCIVEASLVFLSCTYDVRQHFWFLFVWCHSISCSMYFVDFIFGFVCCYSRCAHLLRVLVAWPFFHMHTSVVFCYFFIFSIWQEENMQAAYRVKICIWHETAAENQLTSWQIWLSYHKQPSPFFFF